MPYPDILKFFVDAHAAVQKSKAPNYLGCKIPVPSNINCEYLDKQLQDYSDKGIVLLMHFGCPINYRGNAQIVRKCQNHRGALDFPKHIDLFLEKESAARAVLGPFQKSPFEVDIVISPLNTVPKKDSIERRVIVDLSFPPYNPEQSVNGGICKQTFLGDPIQLRYPSVDNLVQIVRKKGPGCALFKRDLSRAYRQLPVDPGSYIYLI